MEKYIDRSHAGKVLAKFLEEYQNQSDVLILALPRGGVPVAYEVARLLALPLDVFIVRKLGVPGHEELAMGALAIGNITVFNEEIVQNFHISKTKIDEVTGVEKKEIERRSEKYRFNKPFPLLFDKTVILIDDGIATGATMRAAIQAISKQNPKKIVIAVPVASYSTCEEMNEMVDQMICPLRPFEFYAVGAWYENFNQTSDEEVSLLLKSQ